MNFHPGAIEGIKTTWTPERDAELVDLAKAAKSSTDIADILGISRNAVVGRLNRLRIKGVEGARLKGRPFILKPLGKRHGPPNRESAPILKLKPVKAAPPPKPKPPERHSAEPAPLNLRVWEIPDNGCHWPVNDGGPYLFCGHVRSGHPVYCSHHAPRAKTTHIFWGQR